MNIRITALSVAAWICFAFAISVDGQEPTREMEARVELMNAELDLEMLELERAISKREIDAAAVEMEKLELRVRESEKEGDEIPVEFARRELRQAQINLEMRELESKIADIRFEKAKVRLVLLSQITEKAQPKPTRVQFEYDDKMDVIVVRGPEKAVNKIRAMIEDSKK